MNTESKTPRTDAEAVFPSCNDSSDTSHPQGTHVDTDFARKLERERDEYKAALQSADNHNHEIATKLEIVTEQRDEAREQRDRLAGLKYLKYPEDLTVDFVKILLETVKCGGKVITFNDSDICTMERILKGGSHES